MKRIETRCVSWRYRKEDSGVLEIDTGRPFYVPSQDSCDEGKVGPCDTGKISHFLDQLPAVLLCRFQRIVIMYVWIAVSSRGVCVQRLLRPAILELNISVCTIERGDIEMMQY